MYWWMIHRWGDPCKKVWIHVMPLSGAWWEVLGGSAPSATVFFWLRNWTKRNNWLVSGWLWSPGPDPPLRSWSDTSSPSFKIGFDAWIQIHLWPHNLPSTPNPIIQLRHQNPPKDPAPQSERIPFWHQSPYLTQGFCHPCSLVWCSLQACCL